MHVETGKFEEVICLLGDDSDQINKLLQLYHRIAKAVNWTPYTEREW